MDYVDESDVVMFTVKLMRDCNHFQSFILIISFNNLFMCVINFSWDFLLRVVDVLLVESVIAMC